MINEKNNINKQKDAVFQSPSSNSFPIRKLGLIVCNFSAKKIFTFYAQSIMHWLTQSWNSSAGSDGHIEM